MVSVMGIFAFFALMVVDVTPIFLFSIAIIFWVVELLSYALFYIVAIEYNEKVELSLVQQKAKSERENFNLTMKTYEKLRILRHELKNYFAYGNSLLTQQRYDEL